MAKRISGDPRRDYTPPKEKQPPPPRRRAEVPSAAKGENHVGSGRGDVNGALRGPRRTVRKLEQRTHVRTAAERRAEIRATPFSRLAHFDKKQVVLREEKMRRFHARHVRRMTSAAMTAQRAKKNKPAYVARPLDEPTVHFKARIQWEMARERVVYRNAAAINPHLASSAPVAHLALQAAMRRDPSMGRLASVLGRSRPGRPTDRRLAVEVVMRNALEELPIELRRVHMDFHAGCAPALEWAYGEPVVLPAGVALTEAELKTEEKLCTELIQGRRVRAAVEADPDNGVVAEEEVRVKGMLDHHDPEHARREMARAWLRLHEGGRWPAWGTVMSIDGTRLPQRSEQTQSASADHEELLAGGVGGAFGWHGKGDGWRGKNALLMADVLAPPVAPTIQLINANSNEGRAAADFVADSYRRLREEDPEFSRIDVVLGDKAFFDEQFAKRMLFEWSIKVITPWKGGKLNKPWGDNMGVPWCGDHESTVPGREGRAAPSVDMRLEKAEGVWTAEQRARHGIALGVNLLAPGVLASRDQPRLRWVCPSCEQEVKDGTREKANTATTRPKDGAHIYTWHPHKDVHPRYQERLDLLGLRGASESLNSVLKHDCFALAGPKPPECVRSERQMQWWAYMRNLRNTLKVVVRENGEYLKVREEMERLGLLTPGLLTRLRAHGLSAADFPVGEDELTMRPRPAGLYAVEGGGEGGVAPAEVDGDEPGGLRVVA